MLRKCAVFYSAIGAEKPPERFELDNSGNVSKQQIKRDLDPVLRRGEKFVLEDEQTKIRDYLASILITTKGEEMFWRAFSEGNYYLDWVFGQTPELHNILKHPMVLGKCRDKSKDETPFITDQTKKP